MNKRVTLLLLLLLPCCSLQERVDESAAKAITLAGKEARDTIEVTGNRMEELIDRAHQRLDALSEKILARFDEILEARLSQLETVATQTIDKAGDRAEALIQEIPAVTEAATKNAEDFLDAVKDWWLAILGGTLVLVFQFIQWRKGKKKQRLNELLIQSIEGSDPEARADVKEEVRERLEGLRDGQALRAAIRQYKGRLS